jgi:hypothetical protein
MTQQNSGGEIDLEAGIARRMDALVARKRAENEAAIARIATLDTGWKDINGDIDTDLKTGLDTARVEAQAMQDAMDRLTRNVCGGVDKNAFGLAGKVVDAKSEIGLPGLTVKVALGLESAAQSKEAETDNYGDFFFSFELDQAGQGRSKPTPLLIVVLFATDTVVYRDQRSIAPKAGAVEHMALAVDCSGKLKAALEQGKQVAASVQGDAKLVEARAANFDAAYTTFKRLSETTLSQLRGLRQELSVAPPRVESARAATAGSVVTVATQTRLLGNSHARELHDLENVKKQCQIAEIKPDHRVYFRTEREAVAAGYDLCGNCFGKKKKSKTPPSTPPRAPTKRGRAAKSAQPKKRK